MVIIIRSNDIVSDPRAMKYVKYLQDSKIPYRLIGWDRDGKLAPDPNNSYFKRQAGFNVGGFKAVKNRILWMHFIIKTLRQLNIYNPVLHGCDLDATFPAAVYKVLFNKKAKVIFDIFDWFSATLYNQSKYILYAFSWMEKFCIKHSDDIIICEPERIEQIPYFIPKVKLHILPNIPFFSESSFLRKREDCQFNNGKLTFSYVGGFYGERCIKEIIEIAAAGHINLLIAGFGEESYVNRLKELSSSPYIKYFGKVKYQDALSIQYNADVIYAMYATSNPNHIYAAPNKFYESMFLGKPIFTTNGTIVEKKVKKANMGYTSEESEDKILHTILSIKKEDLEIKGQNAYSLWVSEFQNYTQNFMEQTYVQMFANS